MADSPAPIDPDRILEHPFTAVRRGYDPLEVQRYLLQIANQLRSGRDREAELRHQLEESEKRTAPIDDLDPSQLARLLGEETARVLEAAQGAASEIRAKAEDNVGRLLREARDEAQQMREDAETVLSRKTEEAETAAAAIRAEAEAHVESARAEAAALVEAGRQEGREMVAEAQKVRQRMLDDLSRRRKLLRQQIEQLQAGRERLLAAYDVVRETLDVATEELQVALPEAKLAAETASMKDDGGDAAFEAEVSEAAAAVEAAEPTAPEPTDAEPAPPAGSDVEQAAEVAEAVEAEVAVTEVVVVDEAAPAVVVEEVVELVDETEVVVPVEDETVEEAAPAEVSDADEEPPAAEPEPEPETEPVATTGPRPGRRSSSVKVVPAGGTTATATAPVGTDKAADVFARLREEPVTVVDDTIEIEVIESALEAVDEVMAREATDDAPAEASSAEADDVAAGPGDPADELLVRRDAAIADLERNLARRLKRELSDEQNELLASLTSAKGTPTADTVLPAPEAHVERFQAISLPTLAAAATAGADLVSTVAGPPAAPTTVADLAAEVAVDIVAPLRERLERAFATSDGHPDDIAQSIRSCYREWKGQRVDQIASHAVVAACNRGLLDRLPEGALVRWIVADGDSPSPDCEDNALAGAVVRGEPFPTGHTAPPLHSSCRCMVVPADT